MKRQFLQCYIFAVGALVSQVAIAGSTFGLFSEQQAVSFFDKNVRVGCSLPFDIKIKTLKANENCLMPDQSSEDSKKPLIVKMSCKQDLVRTNLVNAAMEYCNSQTAKNIVTEKKLQEDNIKNADKNKIAELEKQNKIMQLAIDAAKKNSTSSVTPPAAPFTAGPGPAPKPSFGPCVGPGACDGTPAPVTYTWKIPAPFMNGPIDMYPYLGGGNNSIAQPAASCGPSTEGQMVAVDFGNETRAVMCMGSASPMDEKAIKKIKDADVAKLPLEIAVKKPAFTWEVLVKPTPPANGIQICGGPGIPSCEKSTVGDIWVVQGAGCGSYKCVRTDGGPVKTASATNTPKTTTVSSPSAPAVVTTPAATPAPPAENRQPASPIPYERDQGGGGE